MNTRLIILAVGVVALIFVIISSGDDETSTAETPKMQDKTVSVKPMKKPDPAIAKELEKERETAQLLAELKTIPVSEYAANKTRYERLLELHPGNETFMRKVAFYTEKLHAQRTSY